MAGCPINGVVADENTTHNELTVKDSTSLMTATQPTVSVRKDSGLSPLVETDNQAPIVDEGVQDEADVSAEPFPSETYVILGIELPVCEHSSCKNKCLPRTTFRNPNGRCICHPSCLKYGDCCVDYYLYCHEHDQAWLSNMTGLTAEQLDNLTNQQVTQVILEAKLTSQNTPQVTQKCTLFKDLKGEDNNFLVIGQCPLENNPSLDFTEAQSMCEGDSQILDFYEQNTLVWVPEMLTSSSASGRLYKNIHCFRCHDSILDANQTRLIPPQFACGKYYDEAMATYTRLGNAAFLLFVSQTCVIRHDFSVLSSFHHLHCPSTVETIFLGSCDPALEGELENFSQLRSACSSYESNINLGNVLYKNPHCALCNGINDTSSSFCYAVWHNKGGLSNLPSFSILMNFDGSLQGIDYSGRKACSGGYYLDFSLNMCIENACEAGSVSLDGDCVIVDHSLPPILPVETTSVSHMLFQIRNSSNVPSYIVPYLTSAFDALDLGFVLLKMYVFDDCSLIRTVFQYHGLHGNDSDFDRPFNVFCVHVALNITDIMTFNAVRLVEDICYLAHKTDLSAAATRYQFIDDFLDKGISDTESMNVVIDGVSLLSHSPTDLPIIDCVDSTKMSSREDDVIVVEQVVSTESGNKVSLSLRVNGTGLQVAFSDVPAVLTWEVHKSTSLGHWPMKVATTYCLPHIFECDKAVLDASEFELDQDVPKLHGHKDPLFSNDYAMVGNGSLLVCLNALSNAATSSNVAEGWLTLIGISLSLLGLALTLVTYFIFPSLRTLPGLGIMNLSLALFLAQLLFELAPLASGNSVLCTIVGVAQHYSWLAAFLWMSVMAFDLCQTFTRLKAKANSSPAHRGRFRVYLVYAWGNAFLVVLTCSLISYLGSVGFTYIDKDNCWLKQGKTLGLTFALPVGVLVLANMYFFVRTALALREAVQLAKQVKSDKDDKNRYAVYVKLSSLMGLTWSLGFVSTLVDNQFLVYMFISMNTLQGLFICMSFVLTSKVFRMYKTKLLGPSPKSNSATTKTGLSGTSMRSETSMSSK